MPDITKGLRVDTISINDQIAVTGGTADPRSTDQGSITILPQGSLYISTTGAIYQKQSTSNLNWGKLVAEDFATGNVGIGNTSPLAKLHVTLSGTLMPTIGSSTVGIFQDTGATDSAISIIAGNANSSILNFGDTNSETVGSIKYLHSDNTMRLSTTNGADAILITAGGSIGLKLLSFPLSEISSSVSAGALIAIPGTNARVLDLISTKSGADEGDSVSIDFVFGSPLSGAKFDVGRIACSTTGVTSSVNGNLIFYTMFNAALNERMRIGSTGNVGIGTTSPLAKLHVTLSGTLMPAIGSTTVATFQNTSSNAVLSLIAINTGQSTLAFGDTDLEGAGAVVYNHASNFMGFNTLSTERMRIDSSGNVGIGTNTHNNPLHVKQGSTTAAVPVETLEQLDTNEPFIEVIGTENTTTGSILTGKTSHSGTKKFIKCKINGVVGYLQWSTTPI